MILLLILGLLRMTKIS